MLKNVHKYALKYARKIKKKNTNTRVSIKMFHKNTCHKITNKDIKTRIRGKNIKLVGMWSMPIIYGYLRRDL